jgi:hypothetical protein
MFNKPPTLPHFKAATFSPNKKWTGESHSNAIILPLFFWNEKWNGDCHTNANILLGKILVKVRIGPSCGE